MTDFWKLSGHCTEEEIRGLQGHADDHDHYVSVVEQFGWLDAAGFRDLDCVWRYWMWGILTARA